MYKQNSTIAKILQSTTSPSVIKRETVETSMDYFSEAALVKELILHGEIPDPSIADELIRKTEQENKKVFFHNIKFWLECYREITMEMEGKKAVRYELFGEDAYYDAVQNRITDALSELRKVVYTLPKWAANGELYRQVLTMRYLALEEQKEQPWTQLNPPVSRSHWFTLLNKATDKVAEIYFGGPKRMEIETLFLYIRKVL